MPSKTLTSQKTYIQFLLSASDKQAKLLLQSATKQQLRFIQEVFYNIVGQVIVFPPTPTRAFLRYRSLIKSIAGKSSLKEKLRLVRDKTQVVLNILRCSEKFIHSALEV